jgi:hypothetical protein
MKKLIFFLVLMATPFLGKASHIVGGEFELVHLADSTYRLNLILYFDLENGNPGARDLPGINVRIFRMSDNAVMQNVYLPFISETSVQYTALECAIAELLTSKLIYSTTVVLRSSEFNDPLGYYVSWERCCRNYEIDNIYSENPQLLGSIYAGQTFYLEFPAVVRDGEPFIDSTPKLFPPLSDYACVNKPYYVDFAGTDDDGDELVYTLVTPLNTKSADALPPAPQGETNYPRPRPYPNVNWRPGYSLNDIMKGNPDLAISPEGLLTVTPTRAGLFVFAVKCEEFRDGVKIGETRRDFQMLAVNCRISSPPQIKGKALGDGSFTYNDVMNITFEPNTPDELRCIQVEVADPDTQNALEGNAEFIKIRARGVNGSAGFVKLPTIKTALLTQNRTSAIFQICFEECPRRYNTPYQIQIIAADDACAVPLLDTLKINVTVKTPPNGKVEFKEPSTNRVIAALREGDPKQIWPLRAVDPDGDSIVFTYLVDGFTLPERGMELTYSQAQKGVVRGNFTWNPSCDLFDFSERQTFQITMIADDKDFCSFNGPDKVQFDLTLVPPPNADPIIDTDITPEYSERFVDGGSHRVFDRVEFNVFGHDDDVGFPISLEAHGTDFEMDDYGMQFPNVSGNNDISSRFTWPLQCDRFDLAEKDSFNIRFIVIDRNNKCRIYQADTVNVALRVLPPVNSPPKIRLINLHPETTVDNITASGFWGQEIEFLINGTDADENPLPDNIRIELVDATGNLEPNGYIFTPASGQRDINARLTWMTDCSIFKNDIFTNTYQFTFRIWDDHCASAVADSVTLTLNISDYVSTDENFQPTNVITPNSDRWNSYFALDGIELREDGSDPNSDINLPLDNCINKFEYINIYNRWGKLVFTSNNRLFKWYAPDAGAGVYFYFIKFTNKDYKGSLLVRF